MNYLLTILLSSSMAISMFYFFSSKNKTLENYKENIEKFGHKLEEFKVTTEDGYILSLWHLIPDFTVNKEKVVFLQPGFSATGILYFGLGEKSLPYLLQEKGYDVWIGNNRGTPPSQKHAQKILKRQKEIIGILVWMTLSNMI